MSPQTPRFQILRMDQTSETPETTFVESPSVWREEIVGMLSVRVQNLGVSF